MIIFFFHSKYVFVKVGVEGGERGRGAVDLIFLETDLNLVQSAQ